MKHFSNNQENHPDLVKKIHKLYNEKGRPSLNIKESQCKLGEQHDRNFLIKGMLLQNK